MLLQVLNVYEYWEPNLINQSSPCRLLVKTTLLLPASSLAWSSTNRETSSEEQRLLKSSLCHLLSLTSSCEYWNLLLVPSTSLHGDFCCRIWNMLCETITKRQENKAIFKKIKRRPETVKRHCMASIDTRHLLNCTNFARSWRQQGTDMSLKSQFPVKLHSQNQQRTVTNQK